MLCAALAALSLLFWPVPREALDWRPNLFPAQPWRAVTAAFVHLTPFHLAANLAGSAVLALLGWRARLGRREALAGLVALPLTQAGLLLRPELERYAGLSGELHALVAIAAATLIVRDGRDRLIGLAILTGLSAKLAIEQPFGPVLSATSGFDFAIAPFAHFCGALAGFIAWTMTMLANPQKPKRPLDGT
jgi:rhomboid family GlyGly-CTERM serine protease